MSILIALMAFNLKLIETKKLPFSPSNAFIYKSNIILSDNGKRQYLAIYSDDMSLKKVIIKGKGYKNNEVIHLTSIDINDGLLGIYDAIMHRVLIYSVSGKFINSFLIPNELLGSSVRISRRGILLTIIPYGKNTKLFYLFSLNGKLLKSFGNINKREKSGAFYVDWENEKIYYPVSLITTTDAVSIFNFKGQVLGEIKKQNYFKIYKVLKDGNYLYISGIFVKYGKNSPSPSFKDIISREIRKNPQKIRFVKGVFLGLDIYNLRINKWVIKDLDLKNYGEFVKAKGDTIWTIFPEIRELRKYLLKIGDDDEGQKTH